MIDYCQAETTWQGRTRKRHRGVLRFYAGCENEAGEPLWIDKFVTLSLHQKSTLRSFLEAWCGQESDLPF